MKCETCGARIIATADGGQRCMNPGCASHQAKSEAANEKEVMCKACDEPMIFKGLNTYGEPDYQCPTCGHHVKL